jgi:hypothetical protein
MAAANQTCVNCKWFKSYKESEERGHCKRYPSTALWNSAENLQVMVDVVVFDPKTNYCGEFKELV